MGEGQDAWQRQGIAVHGAALAGKAAEGLQVASGIKNRTLAALELSWKNGNEPIKQGDVLMIDEAGMIGTRQMSRITSKCQEIGAKLVLVGDPDRLGDTGSIPVIPASEVIEMGDEPASSVRSKKDASVVRAAEAVRDGAAAVPVLMYHWVHPDPGDRLRLYGVTPEAFAWQMRHLHAAGYRTAGLDDLQDHLAGHRLHLRPDRPQLRQLRTQFTE